MTTRTITAMFDGRAEAERAVEALVSTVGLDRSAVRIEAGAATGTATSGATEEKGFFAALKDLFVPDEDRYAYAEGLRRGSVLVTAQVDESRLDRAMDVLEQHGAVDLDRREAEWRQSGWTGYQAAAVGASSDGDRTGVAAMPAAGAAATATTGTAIERTAAATAADLRGEEAIPIVEEQIRIGKREVERGRVRVRAYVVETPVQEQVTLREEHVDVQRRPVDRPVTDADRLFQERTIEATESREEAVVAKEARVTEELVVRKEAEERVQTVQDKVRRTEVEVDDERGAAARATGTTTTSTTRTTGPDRDRV